MGNLNPLTGQRIGDFHLTQVCHSRSGTGQKSKRTEDYCSLNNVTRINSYQKSLVVTANSHSNYTGCFLLRSCTVIPCVVWYTLDKIIAEKVMFSWKEQHIVPSTCRYCHLTKMKTTNPQRRGKNRPKIQSVPRWKSSVPFSRRKKLTKLRRISTELFVKQNHRRMQTGSSCPPARSKRAREGTGSWILNGRGFGECTINHSRYLSTMINHNNQSQRTLYVSILTNQRLSLTSPNQNAGSDRS